MNKRKPYGKFLLLNVDLRPRNRLALRHRCGIKHRQQHAGLSSACRKPSSPFRSSSSPSVPNGDEGRRESASNLQPIGPHDVQKLLLAEGTTVRIAALREGMTPPWLSAGAVELAVKSPETPKLFQPRSRERRSVLEQTCFRAHAVQQPS